MKTFVFLLPLVALSSGFSAMASTEIHQHTSKEIGEGTPVPKIELSVFKDPMDGVNIHVSVQNYVLNAPDMAKNANALSDSGYLQGHAHVFVNAQKRRRLYGHDIHIPDSWLKDGVNQVAISLNSHQHENWVSGDHNIVSSVFFDLSKDPIVLHNFTSQPLATAHHDHH